MNFEQSIVAGMAEARVKLARKFVAAGEISMARFMFGNAIEKMEMVKQIGTEDHAKIDVVIAELRTEISKLPEPVHVQICSTAKIKTIES